MALAASMSMSCPVSSRLSSAMSAKRLGIDQARPGEAGSKRARLDTMSER
jgi:hypothetical protein